LKPRGWTLDIAMVDRQHHRPPRRRVERAREPVLHAPVELVRAFQEKSRRGLRYVGLVVVAIFIGFGHRTSRSIAATVETAWIYQIWPVWTSTVLRRPPVAHPPCSG